MGILFASNIVVLRTDQRVSSEFFVYKVSQLEVAVLAGCPQVSRFLSQNHLLLGWGGRRTRWVKGINCMEMDGN